LQFDPDVCYNLTHGIRIDKNMSDRVQNSAASLEVFDGILVALPAVLFSLFVGAWSDARGRKAVLILPFVGNILSFLIYIVNYHWFESIPPQHLLWGSIAGLTGGYICLNIGLYGYVSDVTSPENRTTRLSILNGVFSAGYVIGTSLGGKLYKTFGSYYLNFGLSIAFGLVGMLYAIFFIEESIIPNNQEERRHFFHMDNVVESINVALKPRPHHARLHVILLIVNFAIFMFPLNTFHYDYLLVINRYNWDADNYSNFVSVQRICRFVGLFAVLPLLSKIIKLPDPVIATIGTLTTIIAYLLMALGPSSWQWSWDPSWLMYISVALQFNSVITVTIRSQCTKEVEKSEIGRIFSVVALGQAIVPLCANPLFGLIYQNTLDTSLPGAYLLCLVVMLLFVLFSGMVMSYHEFKRKRSPLSSKPLIE